MDHEMDIPEGTIILEPRSIFDHAMVGYDIDQAVLIYDFDLLVESLMNSGCNMIESVDYIYFNIIGVKLHGWPIIQDYEKNL